jgi:hypothetical protein
MFGMDALLNSPGLVAMAAKSAGIEAARLDYNELTDQVWLSVRIRGEVKQIPLPTRKTLTIDQLMQLLFPGPQGAGQKTGAQLSAPDVATTESPPNSA